jgi:hypothetical protein
MDDERRKHPLTYPFAFRGEDLIHASELTRDEVKADRADGIEYCCINPDCRSKTMILKAAGSIKKQQHFAHESAECGLSRETAIHIAAKRTLKSAKRILLPPLPAHHLHGPTIQEARNARWREVSDETRILGRWRADVVMNGEIGDPFFAVEETGEATPLVVEIVVTSPVSRRKIEAVQTHSWRMIEVAINAEADLSSIQTLVLDGDNRRWLAHPTWSAGLDEERRRKDEERRLAEEAELRRIDEIMERIRAHRAPEWVANEEAKLEAFLNDHDLLDKASSRCGYDHWMAGDPVWWHAVVLREITHTILRDGLGRAIPRNASLAESIRGFVMPIPVAADEALLAAMGIASGKLGNPMAALTSFLDYLQREELLRRDGSRLILSRALEAVILRNQDIDRRLRPWFVSGSSLAGPALVDRIHRWKSGKFDRDTRRSVIIEGGDRYHALLEQTDELLRRARERFARKTSHATHKNSSLKPPRQGKEDLSSLRRESSLSSVHERITPSKYEPLPNLFTTDIPDEHQVEVATQLPKPSVVDDDYDLADVEPEETIDNKAPDLTRDWISELTSLAERRYHRQPRYRTRAREMAALLIGTSNPVLRGRPSELCIDQETFERCRHALGL